MRTHEFSFTKRTKKTFRAISIDLTVAEAKWILDLLKESCDCSPEYEDDNTPIEYAMGALWDDLQAFIDKHPKEAGSK